MKLGNMPAGCQSRDVAAPWLAQPEVAIRPSDDRFGWRVCVREVRDRSLRCDTPNLMVEIAREPEVAVWPQCDGPWSHIRSKRELGQMAVGSYSAYRAHQSLPVEGREPDGPIGSARDTQHLRLRIGKREEGEVSGQRMIRRHAPLRRKRAWLRLAAAVAVGVPVVAGW